MTDLAAAFAAMQSHQAYLAAPSNLDSIEQLRLLNLIAPDHIGVFSSGSTSIPRCIVRSWDSWRMSFAAIDSRMGVHAGESIELIGSPASTMILFAGMHALHHGAIPRVTTSTRPLRVHPDADVVHAVPTAIDDVLDQVIDGERRTPRLIVTAGAAAPEALWRKAERAGVEMVEYYGAAETSFIAWRHAPGAFEPVPGCDIDIQDGFVWVNSPYLAVGYLDSGPGPMRREGDWVTVGDMGHLDSHGGLILRGRGDTAVTTAGHTVLVEDVEAALRWITGVDDVAVIGIPHDHLGEVIAAVHVGSASSHVLRDAAQSLPDPARPRLWVQREELPRLPGGKVDRRTLRNQLTQARVQVQVRGR